MPTEIQQRIVTAYLIAGVIYREFYFADSSIWLVWINSQLGRVVCIQPDGRVTRFREQGL
jgi:hypothetical protein